MLRAICFSTYIDSRQFPNDEVDEYNHELEQVQQELKEHGILAYEATGSTEEKLAEMVDKMQLTAANPEPAPAANTLIGTLLRRNLLWVTLIKSKYSKPPPANDCELTYHQARTHRASIPGHLRQASCDPK